VTTVNSILFIAIFLAPFASQAQSLKVVPADLDENDRLAAKAVHFFCSQDYDPQACRNDIATLRRRLLSYPIDELGEWSFVLATRNESVHLQHLTDGSSETPALTYLNHRTTIMEHDLFFATTERATELASSFGGRKGSILLEFAISHELGHAFCNEPDEHRAENVGRDLRAGKTPRCQKAHTERTRK
jgi:hypothetical protein